MATKKIVICFLLFFLLFFFYFFFSQTIVVVIVIGRIKPEALSAFDKSRSLNVDKMMILRSLLTSDFKVKMPLRSNNEKDFTRKFKGIWGNDKTQLIIRILIKMFLNA